MADPDKPQPTQPAAQPSTQPTSAQPELADAFKEWKASVLASIKRLPIDYKEIQDQLAFFESVAETVVKGRIHEDRMWAEAFINTEIKAKGFDGDPGEQLAREAEGRVLGKAAEEARQPMQPPAPSAALPSPAGFTPQQLQAQQLLDQCDEIMAKIDLAMQQQEKELENAKSVDRILVKNETHVLGLISQMRKVYARNQVEAKEAKARGEVYAPLRAKLLKHVAELQRIGEMMKEAAFPLTSYDALFKAAQLDAALVRDLSERMTALDAIAKGFDAIRVATFNAWDTKERGVLSAVGITDPEGVMKHLEGAVDRKQRFLRELVAAGRTKLTPAIELYRTAVNALSMALQKRPDAIDYDKPLLADALMKYGDQPMLKVIETAATDAMAILQRIGELETKLAMELDADEISRKFLGKSLEALGKRLGVEKA